MTDHQTEIIRDRDRFTAVCSCGRWRSSSYLEREKAETKATTHEARGDNHLRALAQFSRGSAQLKSEWKWYVEQSEDPLNSPEDREMWKRLADELEPRVKAPPTDDGQEALF